MSLSQEGGVGIWAQVVPLLTTPDYDLPKSWESLQPQDSKE